MFFNQLACKVRLSLALFCMCAMRLCFASIVISSLFNRILVENSKNNFCAHFLLYHNFSNNKKMTRCTRKMKEKLKISVSNLIMFIQKVSEAERASTTEWGYFSISHFGQHLDLQKERHRDREREKKK